MTEPTRRPRGRPRTPEGKKPVCVSVKMDPVLYDRVARISLRTGASVNSLMNSAARLLLWHDSISGSQKKGT